jgi:hypothetical protein
MPLGIADAGAEPSATPPSAASPTTAYFRLIIKLLLGVFLVRDDNRKAGSVEHRAANLVL